ncbi:MAG: hypothetical protein ACRDY7_18015, partial [Acidimicrobiia bacterium]
LSDTAAADEKDPHVAALGQRVAVVYESDDDDDDVADTTDNTDVVIRISDDGGDNFDAAINLTAGTPADGLRQDQPEVGLNDDVVVVVFRVRDPEARIGYVRSTDGGATFGGINFLPGGVEVDDSPGLYMDGDDVHVAACHEADPAVPGDTNRLLYWHSGDAGASFEGPVVIATFAEKCAKPAIDGNGDDLHIAVEGDVAGKGDVFGTHSANGGGTWSAPENLSANPESSGDPAVAVDDDDEDDVHVTWSDQSAFLFSVKYGDSLDLTDGDDRHFANEDVIRYLGNSYETILDGSDVGLRNLRIDAMAELAPTENGDPTRYVLSFTEKAPIPGIDERVDDSDLVLFTPTSLGVDTDGTFELYFEGSGIGLTRSGEDVDAVEIDGADLYLSTYGSFELSDDYGELSGKNEDVFVCRDFALDGCGEAEVVFDGSERELADSGENVDAFGFNEDGNAPKGIGFFSTTGDFETATAQGEDDDLFSCSFPEQEFEDDEETVPVPGTRDGDLGACNDGEADSAFHTTFDADVNRLHEDVMSVEIQF